MQMVDEFSLEEAMPDRATVLEAQGVPRESATDRIGAVCDHALALLAEHAAPIGMHEEISAAAFAEISHGEGRNDPQSPIPRIAQQADALALFAATIGPGVSEEIDRQLARDELALASMLDAAASASADLLSRHLAERLHRQWSGERIGRHGSAVLGYSPGYCGWDITGQRRLFERLHPQRTGIRLTERCLMIPLKSVSGVLIGGRRGIHIFDNNFSFCAQCKTKSCRPRIQALLDAAGEVSDEERA